MADTPPDKIVFGIGSGGSRALILLPDGTYTERVAPAYGSGLVTDSTGEYTFDLGSMASKFQYDANGNQTMVTYGPDSQGRFIRQTSSWQNNLLMAESAWFLVAGLDAP